MKQRACTEAKFLGAVAHHEMTILVDTAPVRVMTFKQPGTINYLFTLVTWPGHLCITGDMGTYVFRRLIDMFEFFRTDRREGKAGLYINLDYWAEKLEAVDKVNKFKEYSYEIFKQVVQERVDEAETTKQQRDAVEELVATLSEEPVEVVYLAVQDFTEFEFCDFQEHDLTEFTYQFVWCCYAIAWGIKRYDAFKAAQPAPVTL